MSIIDLDTADREDGGFLLHCEADGCYICDLFQRDNETDAEWKARLRVMWNTPEAQPAHGVYQRPDPPEQCRQGHPWTEENTMRKPSDHGYRRCRACLMTAQRRRRQESVA